MINLILTDKTIAQSKYAPIQVVKQYIPEIQHGTAISTEQLTLNNKRTNQWKLIYIWCFIGKL